MFTFSTKANDDSFMPVKRKHSTIIIIIITIEFDSKNVIK